MSRGWISNTRKACEGNVNGFLYALIAIDEDPNAPIITHSEDKEFHMNEDIEYIGITNNPIARMQHHRTPKGGKSKKIGMVIFDYPTNPSEGKMMEAVAIYNYCEAKGQGPKFQSGHDTWAGA